MMRHKLNWLITLILIASPVAPDGRSSASGQEISSWSVGIETHGGLVGQGGGSLLITSDGKLTLEQTIIAGQAHRRCDTRQPVEELRRVVEAVRRSHAVDWRMAGSNFAASDAAEYRTELRLKLAELSRCAISVV